MAGAATANLVQAGYVLALYRALQKYGGTVEQAGELSHLALERKLKQIPAFVRHWIGRFAYSPSRMQKIKARAQASQARRYPGDWVFEVVVGDGQTFDVGMDYTECGIDKFMRSQGAEELMPYLCNLDYVTFGALGMGLARTKTLAWGCACCNFRIKKKGTTPPAWPPRFVERACGQWTQGSNLKFAFSVWSDFWSRARSKLIFRNPVQMARDYQMILDSICPRR